MDSSGILRSSKFGSGRWIKESRLLAPWVLLCSAGSCQVVNLSHNSKSPWVTLSAEGVLSTVYRPFYHLQSITTPGLFTTFILCQHRSWAAMQGRQSPCIPRPSSLGPWATHRIAALRTPGLWLVLTLFLPFLLSLHSKKWLLRQPCTSAEILLNYFFMTVRYFNKMIQRNEWCYFSRNVCMHVNLEWEGYYAKFWEAFILYHGIYFSVSFCMWDAILPSYIFLSDSYPQ